LLGGVCNDLKVKNANNWKELALNTKVCNGLVPTVQSHKRVVKLMEAKVRCNIFDVEPRHKSGWVSVRGLNHCVNNLESKFKVCEENVAPVNNWPYIQKRHKPHFIVYFCYKINRRCLKTHPHCQCT
jgi:hypothetical protein